jgi:hypothetical protein
MSIKTEEVIQQLHERLTIPPPLQHVEWRLPPEPRDCIRGLGDIIAEENPRP